MIERFDETEPTSGEQPHPDEDLHRNFLTDDQSGLEAADRKLLADMEYDRKLDAAADRIQNIEGLQPERWTQMDRYEQKATLNEVGRELQHVYHHPAPPLFIENEDDSSLLGAYGDGYQLDRTTGELDGNEYGITMNENGGTAQERLFGDDPRAALTTYAHEFRHSYQHEQAHRSEIPHFRNMVDDADKAGEWSENLQPGAYTSPEVDYEAYRAQAVESDARQFADDLVERVYGRT